MGIPIDPEIADNYRAIAEDKNDPRSWDDIAKLAEEQSSPSLAAYAREQAAGKGDNITPSTAVPSYKNTRSKGLHKDPDGINEPPVSIDKVTPGTRFPDVQPGDVLPTAVDPTGAIDDKLKQVSQNPSTTVNKVQAHPDEALPPTGEVRRSTTAAAPNTIEDAQARYNGDEPPSQR